MLPGIARYLVVPGSSSDFDPAWELRQLVDPATQAEREAFQRLIEDRQPASDSPYARSTLKRATELAVEESDRQMVRQYGFGSYEDLGELRRNMQLAANDNLADCVNPS